MTLHCPVEIFVPNSDEVRHTITVNISSRGLYCLLDSPLAVGERLHCRIDLSPKQSDLGTHVVYLDCVVAVVRVEATADGYGVGCRIVRHAITRQDAGDSSRISAAVGSAASTM